MNEDSMPSKRMVPDITFPMWDAGIATFRRWNPDKEDVEALVAAIFMSMWEARPVKSAQSAKELNRRAFSACFASMASKRMVPAQQLSDAGEDLVRLAAAKDAEIAALTEQRDEARAAYAALRDQYGELLNATCGECDVLTEQRDRANKALIAVSEMLYQRPDMVAALRPLLGPAEHAVFDEAAAALHAAAETEGT